MTFIDPQCTLTHIGPNGMTLRVHAVSDRCDLCAPPNTLTFSNPRYIICWQSEDGLVLENDPPRSFDTLEKADAWIASQTHKPGYGYAVVKIT